MTLNVAILLGAVHVKKSTAGIASHINNVVLVGSLSATNVNKQKCVMSCTVKNNYVRTALKRRHATVAVLLDVGIVFYLISVITFTATKLFA